MKCSFVLSLCAVALAAFTLSSARADDIDITLEFSGGAWQLYAEVTTGTPDTADGSLGLSAIRALIDNADFGSGGDGVTIPMGIGAINPIDAGGANERPPVLDLGGTLDILYGQDISATGLVVGGVGVGGRDLIASGTYSGGDPAFGVDGSGLTTQGLFLTSTTPGGGNAIDPDNNNLAVVGGGAIDGDYDNSGLVGQGDLDLVLLNWGDTAPPVPVGWVNQQPVGLIGQGALDGVLLKWGNTSLAATAAVPEPTSIALGGIAVMGLFAARRRS